MKCIKKGNKHPEQVWRGKCCWCESEFEAELPEFKVLLEGRTGYTNRYIPYAMSDCNECRGKSSVKLRMEDRG